VFESTAEAVIVADAGRRIIAVNPAFSRITGYRDSAVCGRALESVLTSTDDPALWERWQRDLENAGRWQGERWEHRQDGSLYRARLGITVVRDDRQQIDRYVVVMSDTTPLLRTQEQVDFLTHYDPLTGLVNRSRFPPCRLTPRPRPLPCGQRIIGSCGRGPVAQARCERIERRDAARGYRRTHRW
jgi:PAS domain S-box-containing protein